MGLYYIYYNLTKPISSPTSNKESYFLNYQQFWSTYAVCNFTQTFRGIIHLGIRRKWNKILVKVNFIETSFIRF